MRKMIIFNVLISTVLFFSCAKETQKETSVSLLTKEKLGNSYIQLIPSRGILLDSDSILIGKTAITDLLTKLDTNSIKLTVDSPKRLVISTMDSPPPGYTGEYKHRPDEYFTDYSSTLKFDSLTFCFYYNSIGQTVFDKNIYMDSLRIRSIVIKMPLNAGLFEDLKIGDFYEQIFKHFERPEYFSQLDSYRKEIKFNGVVFTIETDKSKVENYGRIIKIEINNSTVY